MKLSRIHSTAAAFVLCLLTATAILPVPSANAIWPFGGVRAHVSGSTGMWVITNSKNAQVAVKYRARIRGSNIWQNHSATVPANSDRLLGYDSKTYKLEVVSHTP